MIKSKVLLTAVVATAVAIVASLLIERRAQAKSRANDSILRQQDNQLAQLAEENQRYHNGDFNLLEHNHEKEITFGGGPRADGKLNEARAITAALREYADE